MAEVLAKLKTFDAYAKTLDDFKVKTHSGAIISIVSIMSIVFLIISEYIDYQSIHTKPELVVDKTRRERLKINIDVTFPSIPCNLLNMDVMDVAGEQQNDLHQNMNKIRIDKFGKVIGPYHDNHDHGDKETGVKVACGDCYGAKPPESGCCNTCDDVRNAYARMGWSIQDYSKIAQCANEGWAEKVDFQSGEGCRMYGSTTVNKVSGNFHFAPDKSYQHNTYHIHDVQGFTDKLQDFHFTHHINSLSFGEVYEGMLNPLDGYEKNPKPGGSVFFQYYIKVVPTKIKYLNGTLLNTNQFSVTEYEKPPHALSDSIPGVFFNYDISSMMVIYTETKKSFSAFMTEVCAITGGVFAVARLLDTFVYSAERSLAKKIELGKHN